MLRTGDIFSGDINRDTVWMGKTPTGIPYAMGVRPATSDWNTCNSVALGEYNIPSGLTGWGLDVGAHIGAATIPLLLDNPELRAVAIEALPDNVWLLSDNAQRNGVADRLTILGGAASGSHDSVAIRYGEDAQHRFIGNADVDQDVRPDDNDPRFTMCVAYTLEDVLGITDHQDVQWTKIDCEGCEYAFLRGVNLPALRFITGEVHRGWDRLVEQLSPTHEVFGPGLDFGPFTATRRSGRSGLTVGDGPE